MMYNPQLETFLCVADAGSFNKAAATLYITPTAVVRQVNLLESSLGLTLSTRCSRWCSVRWKFTIPFGILHAPAPSPTVERFLEAIRQVTGAGEELPRGPMTRRTGPSPLDGGKILRYNTKLYSSDCCRKETSQHMNADGDAEPDRPTFNYEFSIRA